MTPASAARRAAAERIAPVYAANPKVAAVILAGSTARGHADRFSDIELGVFWHEPPTEDERLAAVEQAGGELETLYPVEDDAWYDDWKLGRHGGVPKSGVSIDMPHQTTATVEATLTAVLVRHDPDPLKQNTISAIVDGIPLHGYELLEEWRERANPYPGELATSVVRMHGQVSHFWRFRMLAARRNPLHAYMGIVSTHETVLHVLLAVNRVYYFGFKSLDAVMARLPIAPPDLDRRLRRAYELGADADAELRSLVEETYDLVERNVPNVDVDRLRRIFRYQRPLWNAEPIQP
jgi:hypothetical protein